jgi:hypothetical protein
VGGSFGQLLSSFVARYEMWGLIAAEDEAYFVRFGLHCLCGAEC